TKIKTFAAKVHGCCSHSVRKAGDGDCGGRSTNLGDLVIDTQPRQHRTQKDDDGQGNCRSLVSGSFHAADEIKNDLPYKRETTTHLECQDNISPGSPWWLVFSYQLLVLLWFHVRCLPVKAVISIALQEAVYAQT